MRLLNTIPTIALCLLLAKISFAAEADHGQLIELAEVTGIYDQIEQQKIAISEQGRQIGTQYAQQLLQSNQDLSPEIQSIYEKEFEAYMDKTSKLIDSNAAVNLYIQLISQHLSKAEVEEIVSFYKSDVGKKYTESNILISKEWTKSLMVGLEKKLLSNVQELTNNLTNSINSLKK